MHKRVFLAPTFMPEQIIDLLVTTPKNIHCDYVIILAEHTQLVRPCQGVCGPSDIDSGTTAPMVGIISFLLQHLYKIF